MSNAANHVWTAKKHVVEVRPSVIWLHFLDHDVLELFKLRRLYNPRELYARLSWFTSIACLFARDYVAIPAALFIETELGVPILESHAPFVEAGVIRATGNALHVFEYHEKRVSLLEGLPDRQRSVTSVAPEVLRRVGRIWLQKPSGTTRILADGWRREVFEPDGHWRRWCARVGVPFTSDVANSLLEVPNRLTDSAFTSELALKATRMPRLLPLLDATNWVLSRLWTSANIDLLNAAVMTQLPGFNVDPVVPPFSTRKLPVMPLLRLFRKLDILDVLHRSSAEVLFDVAMHPDWRLFASLSWDLVDAADGAGQVSQQVDFACSQAVARAKRRLATVRQLDNARLLGTIRSFVDVLSHQRDLATTPTRITLDRPVHRRYEMSVRLFVSHSSKDQNLTAKLVEVLTLFLDLAPGELRCTSVPGFMLPAGSRTSDTLREEILGCDAVVGIVSERSVSSAYVLFELGAAWGLGRPTFPLVPEGLDLGSLPGPLKETHASRLTSASEIHQFLDDLVRATNLRAAAPNAARLADKIQDVVAAASNS
jgi:hypothetical protein